FSSRRRHTSSKRDWSSDVCSSDLLILSLRHPRIEVCHSEADLVITYCGNDRICIDRTAASGHSSRRKDSRCCQYRSFFSEMYHRSEERRVGKEGGSMWHTESYKSI